MKTKPAAEKMKEAHLAQEVRGEFITKDSGQRKEYASGMRRDLDDGKPRYDLIPLKPLKRLAELYCRGAVKYGDDNWRRANSEEELQRFKGSFLRHAFQWLAGENDEDHAIAAVWNIFAYLTIEEKLNKSDGFTNMAPHAIISDLLDNADSSGSKPLSLSEHGTTLSELDIKPRVNPKHKLSEPDEKFDGPMYYERIKEGEL